MRILIVESAQLVAETLATGLHRCGHMVDVAADSTTALVLCDHNDFDVVLLNGDDAEVDGIVLSHALRRRQCMATIVLARRKSPSLPALDAQLDAIDDVIGPPFALAELVARLDLYSEKPMRIVSQSHKDSATSPYKA